MARQGIKGVKAVTVDNYQGEENKVVILSCVRCNYQDKIGFTGTCNRITVALSRAKLCQIVVGNLSFLSSHNPTWRSIVSLARTQNLLGDSLHLVC